MKNRLYTFPQVRLRVQANYPICPLYYEIYGGNGEQPLQQTGSSAIELKNGLMVEYNGDRHPQVCAVTKITWENVEIEQLQWNNAMNATAGLNGGSSPEFKISEFDDFGLRTFGNSIGIVNHGQGSYYPHTFTTYGEQINWRNTVCAKYGDCDEPNILVTWVANDTFQIDYEGRRETPQAVS